MARKRIKGEKDCVFCSIVSGKLDSAKIWEDDEFLAIFDINPNMSGATLVMTKEHYDSHVFDLPNDYYERFLMVTKNVAKLLQGGLKATRIVMIMEGLRVNHAHIKLCPLQGVNARFKEMIIKRKTFFNCYSGYITSPLGPRADLKELKKFAGQIRKG